MIVEGSRRETLKDMESGHSSIQKSDDLMKKNTELEKRVHEYEIMESTQKHDVKLYKWEPGVQINDTPVGISELFTLARYSSIVRTVTLNLKNEIFRRGLRWRKRYVQKCVDCGMEYQHTKLECECGCKVFITPNQKHLENFESFVHCANKSYQPIMDVFKECEEDLEIADDAYMILVKQYTVSHDQVLGSAILEVVRGDPDRMKIVANAKGERGGVWWVCVEHRNVPVHEPVRDRHQRDLGRVFESPGFCPECGLPLMEVHFVATTGGERSGTPEQYYVDGEVIHFSKYSPSKLYGYSPLISIWKETTSLLNMQHFINEYFRYMRAPRGVVVTNTANPDSAYKRWDQIVENVKKDPAWIPFIAVQGNDRKGMMEWISFSETLNEMQYSNVRDELRVRISTLFGVSNIMMGDTKGAGGIGNEGLQIVVSDRAIQWGQEIWNNDAFPELCRQFGIFDYTLELAPNVELAEAKKLELEMQKAQLFMMYSNLGFEVGLDDEGDLIITGKKPEMVPGVGQPGGGAPPGGAPEATDQSLGMPNANEPIQTQPETGGNYGKKILGVQPKKQDKGLLRIS